MRPSAEAHAACAAVDARIGAPLAWASARALRAAKALLRQQWLALHPSRDREARRALSQAQDRIDEELIARELDGTIAPRASTSRGFKL